MKTPRFTSILTCSIVALTLAAASVAKADTYVVNAQSTNFTGTAVNVAQFNTALGTLNSVDITLSGFGTTDIIATETAGKITSVSTLYTSVGLQLTDSLLGLSLTQSLTGQPLVGGNPISGFNPLSIAASSTYNSGLLALSGLSVSDLGITSNLLAFEGNGNLVFLLAGLANTTESFSGGNLNTSQTTNAGANVIITYNYTPFEQPPSNTPEPGTLSLFGTGLLGLAGLVRRRFVQSR